MRAFVVAGPGRAGVAEVAPPEAGPGEVVVEVERAGVCGTDAEFYAGTMAYLHSGEAAYPMRIGHEWCGTVAAVGPGADPAWLGRRVTGETALGCDRCARCAAGRHHLCADRQEIGVRGGRAGALAERLAVPVRALHALPPGMPPETGALVEPGGNALRAVRGARLSPGERLLVLGPGTIGLLAAHIAAAQGAEVHVLGLPGASLDFARSTGLRHAWSADTLPRLRYDAVLDASNAPSLPARAVELVEPGGRVVLIGLAGEPSLLDSRALALKDATAVGVLSASGGFADTIALYASGAVDPRPLVAATVPLGGAATALRGDRPAAWGAAPKVLVDPRL